MKTLSLSEELKNNAYPGRGIVLGKTPDGKKAVAAYFIMGRSSNSRNRVFVEDGEGIRTQAFDPSKMEDPSLIIYAPVRVLGNKTIVTNGDQTDTIYEGMDKQMTFEQSLRSREFEPDGPNYTPRISGIMHIENGHYNYAMSILKSNNGDPEILLQIHFWLMRILLPEKDVLSILTCMTAILFQALKESLNRWRFPVISTPSPRKYGKALNEENKVSLFVRFIDIETGKYETRIVNKNQ